jgi:hypothetical protein
MDRRRAVVGLCADSGWANPAKGPRIARFCGGDRNHDEDDDD